MLVGEACTYLTWTALLRGEGHERITWQHTELDPVLNGRRGA